MTDTPTKPEPQWAISENERRKIGKRRNAIHHRLRITYRSPARELLVSDETLFNLDEHLQGKVFLGTDVDTKGTIRHQVLVPSGRGDVFEWPKSGRLGSGQGRVGPELEDWNLNSYVLAILLTKKELGAHIECIDHPKPPAVNQAAFAEDRRRITDEDREFFRNGPGRSPDLQGPAQRALHYPQLRFTNPAQEDAQ